VVAWLVLCLTSPLELGRKYFSAIFYETVNWYLGLSSACPHVKSWDANILATIFWGKCLQWYLGLFSALPYPLEFGRIHLCDNFVWGKCLLIPWLVLCLTSTLELGRKYFSVHFLKQMFTVVPWLVLCLTSPLLYRWDANILATLFAENVYSGTLACPLPGRPWAWPECLVRWSTMNSGSPRSSLYPPGSRASTETVQCVTL